jgi:hypothetical protein
VHFQQKKNSEVQTEKRLRSEKPVARCAHACTSVLVALYVALALIGGHLVQAEPALAPDPNQALSLALGTGDLDDPEREVLPDIVEQELLENDPWVEAVTDLAGNIARLEKTAADADELYVKLGPVLRDRLDLLEQQIGSSDSVHDAVPSGLVPNVATLEDLVDNVERLYEARLELFDYISPDLHEEVTGTKLFGAQELRTEIRYVLLTIRYQALGLPAAWELLQVRMERAPLRFVTNLLQIVILFVLFSWWRRWFPETLESMRRSLMATRPRSPVEVRRLKVIWYIEQIRAPVEWLVVLALLYSLLYLDALAFARDLVFIVLAWLLVARTLVLLINAVSARGDVGLTGREATLRLKSLRLVAGWLLVLGIGLSLADYLTGAGAFHAWVWRVFKILFLPVAILLIAWWRPRIFARLALEPDESGRLQETLQHQRGLKGFMGAASGLGYLSAGALRRAMLKRVGAQDVLSELAQNKVADMGGGGEAEAGVAEDTLSLRSKLLAPAPLYAKYARAERRQLTQRINGGASGAVLMTGPGGIGKSRFLTSLEDRIDGEMIYVECRSRSATEFLARFQAALDLPATAAFDVDGVKARLSAGDVRLIAVDNVHRLIRPVVGRQQELDSAMGQLRQLAFDGYWVYAIDRYAWRYIRAAQPRRAYADSVMELPPWTEEQLGEFIAERCEALSIDPDFSDVVLPRQFLDAAQTTVTERNRAGIIRMLTDYSDGNPSIALHLWADCLVWKESGEVTGMLPTLGSTTELDNLPLEGLLVLRMIVQFERVNAEDLQLGLRISGTEVETAVRLCLAKGWIEEQDGMFTVSWRWFPVITRILARQNLLAR